MTATRESAAATPVGTGDEAVGAASAAPIRAAMLLDGNEQYGLPTAVGNALSAIDPARVCTHGIFLGRGIGYDLLAPRFHQTHCLEIGPLFPLRRPNGPRIDPLFLAGRFGVLLRALPGVARCVRADRIQILHTHTWRMALVARWATRRIQLRRVWHCHGAYPFAGRGSRRFVRFARKGIDRVFAISKFVADTLPDELRQRCRVLYNSVDCAALCAGRQPGEFRRHHGLRPEQPLIGIFGAVVPIKGHRYFIEAAARAAARHPEARFAVVGGTTEAFEKRGALHELNEQIERMGLSDRVIQTGFLPDAARYICDFDAIVMPSISTPSQAGEGFGMVLIEAMAQGVAVVSTRCGAPPEIVTDGVDGLLVPPADSDALADALLNLLGDRDLRLRLATAGAATVARRFDARVAAAALEGSYAELIGSSRP